MRTVDDVDLSLLERPQSTFKPNLFERLEQRKLLVVLLTLAVGFFVRIYHLDAAGFAEDEANKIFAIRAYEQGDFTANAEHPMVMKMLCFASTHLATRWNALVGQQRHLEVSEETALRFPNALFGALTLIPLFLLTNALLGFRVALVTSLFWAFGLDAIWFNRTVKEDTLLVFFMFWGFYLYNRAKQSPAFDVSGQERLYALAGAAFGLMMASKYFPHYWALNALFYSVVGYDSRNNRPLTKRMWSKYFGAMLTAFVVFNPALFLPQTWRYLWKYVNEELLTHHGYLVMDRLFINDFMQTPGGNPWYFYFLFLGVKVPLPVLVAFVVGLVQIFSSRANGENSRGYLFLRMMLLFWLIPEAIVGTKFLRYSLSLLPLVYMTAAVGTVTIWNWLQRLIRRAGVDLRFARPATAIAIAAIFVVAPMVLTIESVFQSYPSLYVNVFGRKGAGYYFPHDEFYDLGARESIKFIADNAPVGAKMASEIPGVVQYYLERYRRTDIGSEIISQPSFSLTENPPNFVMLQRGRVYIENVDNFNRIEKSFSPVQASVFDGATASTVYATCNQIQR
jgi:hypothetical protein